MRSVANEPLARHALAFVLAGGRGSRLLELTDRRAKPAVYFGGKSRIIDFALSNALNSGIRRIAVATQYKAHSLIRHLQMGWNFFRPERNESFDILPASQRVSESMWYVGTADAVYQNIDIIEPHNCKYIVAAGRRSRLQDGLRDHAEAACREQSRRHRRLPRNAARGILSAFGVMHIDDNDVIKSFLEKPADPPPMPGKPDKSLASMGIYVFSTDFLYDELKRDAADPNSSHDFGKDIIPYIVKNGRAVAHQFSRSCVRSNQQQSYWRDAGTVDAYWSANIDLTDVIPELDLYDRSWPIWSYAEITPPAKFVHDEDGRRGEAVSSLVSGGCIVSGASLRRSLLFTGVHLHSHARVENAVILPYVDVARHARLKNVVVDRGVKIPEGLVVGEDPELDAKRFRVTENGISLITQPMIDKLNA